VIAPAFGLVETKGLVPHFTDIATKAREPCWYKFLSLEADTSPRHQMAEKWSSIIENDNPGNSAVIDANMWMGKATLDGCVSV